MIATFRSPNLVLVSKTGFHVQCAEDLYAGIYTEWASTDMVEIYMHTHGPLPMGQRTRDNKMTWTWLGYTRSGSSHQLPKRVMDLSSDSRLLP